jgi:hypothetical protein
MSFDVQVLPRAHEDVIQILSWIKSRSPQGAVTWYAAYESLLNRLTEQPVACGPAPEARILGRDLRQAMFKTRQGNIYRAVFIIEADTVYLLRVRGTGQPPLEADEV